MPGHSIWCFADNPALTDDAEKYCHDTCPANAQGPSESIHCITAKYGNLKTLSCAARRPERVDTLYEFAAPSESIQCNLTTWIISFFLNF